MERKACEISPNETRVRDKSKNAIMTLVALLVLSVCELMIMSVLTFLTGRSSIWFYLADALILSLVAYPIMNAFMVKPLAVRYDRISGALLEAEQKSKSIFKTAANLILTLNADGVIIDCNRQASRVLGCTPRDIIGKSVISIIRPEYIARARISLSSIKSDYPLYNEIMQMFKKDGSTIDVSISSSTVRDNNGNFVMCIWLVDDITERKRTEEELQLTKFSLERSLDPAYWVGPDARILQVNEAACNTLGYSREELLSMTVHDISPEFKPERWLPHWIELKKRLSFVIETKHRTKSGKIFPVEITVNYVEFQGHEYDFAFVRDISDRKRAEAELKAVNEHLKLSIEQIPMAYILWDSQCRVREWNRAAQRIFGFTREEAMGKSLPELIIPVMRRSEVQIEFERLLEGRPAAILAEKGNIRKDGALISCHWHNTPLKGKDGKIFAVLSMAEDVTSQIQVQRELKSANEKFKELMDLLPQTVFELDTEGNVVYTNRHGYEVSGFTPEDLEKGINGLDLFADEDKPRVQEFIARILGGEKIEGAEFVMFKKGGVKADVLVFASAISGEQGPLGIRGILVDITETKKLHEFAARAQRLEIAGRIAGQVAHDFNNLLGPLFAFPKFIKESLPEGDLAIQYLDNIEKAAEQMAEINQQLLTLGRRGHYNQVPLNLNEIINQTLSRFEPMPDTIILEKDLAPDLKSFTGGASQISRAISNLITNAFEAMNNSGHLTIKTENFHVYRIWTRYGHVPEGEYIKFTITDSGCGISREIIPSIFDPFFTTKSADSKRGSGLGLSVVQAVVEDHGGYIDVKSEPGKGASFYVYFPAVGKCVKADDAGELMGGHEKVLLVDDDRMQREVALSLLKKLGYDATAVESGEKALEYLADHPQDLILLDMVMPSGMDGAETFEKIVQIYPEQKAIIVSGYADSARIEAALRQGARGFVGKPLSLKSIARAVRDALDGKKVNV